MSPSIIFHGSRMIFLLKTLFWGIGDENCEKKNLQKFDEH